MKPGIPRPRPHLPQSLERSMPQFAGCPKWERWALHPTLIVVVPGFPLFDSFDEADHLDLLR